MDYEEITDDRLRLIRSRIVGFKTNTIGSRSWDKIHNVVQLCSKFIYLVHEFGKNPPKAISDDAATSLRFYNESVDFILGKRRPIRIETWRGIIENISGVLDRHGEKSNVGTLGTGGNPFIGRRKTQDTVVSMGAIGASEKISANGNVASSFGSYEVKRDLLSYELEDIMSMWISRENGIDDMLFTLGSLAELHVEAKISNQ